MRKSAPILAATAATLAFSLFSLPVRAQDAATPQSYFMGKQVVVKIDMPGSQKGVDLRFNKPSPLKGTRARKPVSLNVEKLGGERREEFNAGSAEWPQSSRRAGWPVTVAFIAS